MTGRLTDWLQLFRAPTLPVVMLPIMAGFLAAGGELFSLLGASFFFWSWLVHHFTFAHNSLADAVSGHDQEKNSTTRPLIRGSISIETARKVVYPGLVSIAGLGVLLSLSAGGRAGLSLAFLVLFYALGHAYNGVSKVTVWSFLPISAAFACLPAYSYYAVGGGSSPLIAVFMGFTFLTMWFEVDWEGGLKDVQMDENSLIRDLGVSVKSGMLKIPFRAKFFARMLKLLGLGLITYEVLWHSLTPQVAVAWGCLAAVAVISTFKLTVNRSWNKAKVLAYVGLEEVVSFSLLLLAAVPVSGWVPVLALVAFGAAWVPAAGLSVYRDSPRGMGRW